MSDNTARTMERARAVTPTTKRPSPALGARVLEIAECHALLRERGWGILSITEVITARPYAVPVAYAFDGDAIYISLGRGRKLRALENYPNLCLSVCDVERLDCWRSVVVTGTARWLTDAGSRIAAIRAFVKQNRPGGRMLSPAAATRLVGGRTFRIEVTELSGRANGQPARLVSSRSS